MVVAWLVSRETAGVSAHSVYPMRPCAIEPYVIDIIKLPAGQARTVRRKLIEGITVAPIKTLMFVKPMGEKSHVN